MLGAHSNGSEAELRSSTYVITPLNEREARAVWLFKPMEKAMLVDYPELKTYPEFTSLQTDADMVFVWFFSNRTSPLYRMEPLQKKTAACIKQAYSNPSQSFRDQYMSGNFPSAVLTAMKRMESFSPTIRLNSKMLYEKMYKNLHTLANIDINDVKPEDQSNYLSIINSVVKQMPEFVKRIEENFGIEDIKLGKAASSENLMDDSLESNFHKHDL